MTKMTTFISNFMDRLPSIFNPPPRDLSMEESFQHLGDQCLPGLLGLKIEKVSKELSIAHIDYQVKTAALHGLMHGGTIFSAGDTITAMMLMLFGDENSVNVLTTGAEIRYLRPVPEGRITLHSVVKERKGERFKLVVDFLNEKGKRVAQGKYNYLMITQKES